MTYYNEPMSKEENERWLEAPRYDEIINLSQVSSLRTLLRRMSAAAYEASDGSYGYMPTWGPETERVKSLINSSCADGDIVSWDTRHADPKRHSYLLRHWQPACKVKHEFTIVTEKELAEWE